MKEKFFIKMAVAWTVLVFIVNLVYVPYLIMTTTGGEQAPFIFIVKSILVWGLIGGVLLAIHLVSRNK